MKYRTSWFGDRDAVPCHAIMMHSLKNRPRKRRSIPLNLVRPSKRQGSKRIKVDHVRGTLPVETPPRLGTLDGTIDGTLLPGVDEISDNEIDCCGESDSVPSTSTTTSAHTKRKEKAALKWDEIHQSALTVMIEESSLPAETKCFVCGIESVLVRCLQCGPQHFFCEKCATELHTHALFHHCPELWKDGCYVPLDLPTPLIVEVNHNCADVSRRVVVCFHTDGIPRKISFPFCACESDCIKLIRLHYWPATSSKPLVAFTFHFLDWLEALLLECQVAVQDMTQAISYLIRDKLGQMPCQLYPVLIDSFEEYRHAKHRLRSLESILPTPLEPSCPACPKRTGTVTVAIDALFGLCRKKAAGASVRKPLSNSRMFESQSEVDAFVDSYSYGKTTSPKACNNFLAGDALRSKTRFKALDETGVMGAVCRHEVPICFFNLHHGERISYAVFLMKKLKSRFPNHHVQLMYDVACLLYKHVQAHQELKNEFGDFCTLAIPIFHCFGHKLQCQIQFGPRNLEKFGLSDGEGMERLWSYLRRYSRMTKEMRPSHRIDVLTDALTYCARKTISNIDAILVKRIQRAQKVEGESSMKLEELMTSFPESVTMENIEMWLEDETSYHSMNSTDNIANLTWEEEYVKNLEMLLKLQDESEKIGEDDSNFHDKMATQTLLIEKRLKAFETKHHVTRRWEPECVQYQVVKKTFTTKTRNNLLVKIKDLARERWVLLALKAKYADGLAMACRLAKRITVVSTQIKKMITCHNELEGEPLTWQAATELHNMHIPDTESSELVSCEVKRQAGEHLRLLKRAREEICRLKDEMANCLTFYCDKIGQLEGIQEQLTDRHQLNRLTIGSLNLVRRQLRCDQKRLLELQRTFSTWIAAEMYTPSADPTGTPQTSLPSISSPPGPSYSTTQSSIFSESPSSTESCPHTHSHRSSTTRDSTLSQTRVQSTATGNRSSVDTLSSKPCSLTSPSMVTVSATRSTQTPFKRVFNFGSSGSPFIPRLFRSKVRSEQEKETNVSSCAEAALVVEPDKASDSFVNEPSPTSVRVPNAKTQPSLIYTESEDEESSEDEEMHKQTWRAERFHMEEFLSEMRAKETLTLDMLLSESDRNLVITSTKQPVAAVMRPASFLKKPG